MRLSARPLPPSGASASRPTLHLASRRGLPCPRAVVETPPPPSTEEAAPALTPAGAASSPCSSLRAGAASALLYPHDPLPPAARPTAVATLVPGKLWTFTSPFYASPISKLSAENRMTVAALEGLPGAAQGSSSSDANPASASSSSAPFLALFNPLTPTQDSLDALAATGLPVGAIVIPSTSPEHWVGAAGCAAAFPDAAILAPPGFFSAGPGGGRIGGKLGALAAASAVLDAAAAAGRARELTFAGGSPAAAAASLWGGQVDAALFAGQGGFVEVAFRLAATKTVLTADLAFGLLPSDLAATPGANWLDGALARLAGIYGKLGCATWPVLRASPAEAAAFVGVLDGWAAGGGVEAVVPAHLSAPWGGDALDGAFGWVKRA